MISVQRLTIAANSARAQNDMEQHKVPWWERRAAASSPAFSGRNQTKYNLPAFFCDAERDAVIVAR